MYPHTTAPTYVSHFTTHVCQHIQTHAHIHTHTYICRFRSARTCRLSLLSSSLASPSWCVRRLCLSERVSVRLRISKRVRVRIHVYILYSVTWVEHGCILNIRTLAPTTKKTLPTFPPAHVRPPQRCVICGYSLSYNTHTHVRVL